MLVYCNPTDIRPILRPTHKTLKILLCLDLPRSLPYPSASLPSWQCLPLVPSIQVKVVRTPTSVSCPISSSPGSSRYKRKATERRPKLFCTISSTPTAGDYYKGDLISLQKGCSLCSAKYYEVSTRYGFVVLGSNTGLLQRLSYFPRHMKTHSKSAHGEDL